MQHILNNECGQGMVEYGLAIALVALVVIAGLTAFGGSLSNMVNNANNKLFGGN